MKTTTTLLLAGLTTLNFGLGTFNGLAVRLVINDNAYINIKNGAYLVIDTPSTNGIMSVGAGGNILSEADTNYVKWNFSTAIGKYTIPFTANDGTKIPFVFNKTTAGTASGTGNLTASTYPTAADDNLPLPKTVTNLYRNGADNSLFVADRFWRVDVNEYSANPTADLTFTYNPTNELKANNTIAEANLQAQRWNSATSQWESPVGSVGIAADTVGVLGVTSFSPWVLVDNSFPLPITLLSFDATPAKDSNNKYFVRCHWSTATEINNDYFSIENSKDGKTFEQIGTRQGAGNSSTTLYYRFDDWAPYTGLSYYQLKQTDYDGKYSYSNIVAVYIGEMDLINISPSPAEKEIEYTIKISETSSAQVKVINVLGQEVINHTETIEKGLTQKKIDISTLASGFYMLSINTERLGKTEKKFAVK